jgi:dTDP-4-amino-4,6-dideoxygalactose transaminase
MVSTHPDFAVLMNKNIAVLQPKYYVEECLAEIRQCLEVGWTGMGFKTDEFENAWKAMMRDPNAYFVASATAGLQLAVKYHKESRGWHDGDEVISTPLTFVSTNHAILYEGLKPVFADVDESLCLDPASIEKRITNKTRAVMYVGLGGNPGRLLDAIGVAKRHGLVFILDAAHMSGSKIDGKCVSTALGYDVGVYSFHAVKNLPTADGGMVCCAEKAADTEIRKYGWLGIDKTTYQRSTGGRYTWKYDVQHIGLKAHGNSVMAAIGLVQLKYLEADNERRRALAARYDKMLSDAPTVRRIPVARNATTSRHLYQIRVPAAKRDQLIDALCERNVHVGMHYMLNTHYPMYAYGMDQCPNAERAEAELITLPLHLNLSEDDVEFVGESVLELLPRL